MKVLRRAAALLLVAAGLLLGGGMVVSLADGPSSYWVFLAAVTFACVSLPVVVLGSHAHRQGLAAAGTAVVLIGLLLVVLFNLQGLLMIADRIGAGVSAGTMDLGRRAVPPIVGAGLLLLALAWSRAGEDTPVRAALALIGVAGAALAFRPEGREQFIWYLSLGALWLYLGLTALIDARRRGHARPAAR